MPIIRKQLRPSDVYPDNIRYNESTDTVESLIDGDWVENPEADPRRQTVYPPRVTSDTKCDAAESVKDAFKNQIDGILTAIDGGATAFAIAGTILGLFAFGPFGVFISLALFIADQMLSAGTTALAAALTPEVWDDFACILYCNMDSNGRLDGAKMATVQSQISGDIGGLAAGILNSMLNLAGFGGVNNLGSIGTSTGDCDECDCPGWPEIQWWTQALEVSPGVVTPLGEGKYRVSSGTNLFSGTYYNACCFRNVSPFTECFVVVSMTWIVGSECSPVGRRYRVLCGGGEGFGDFVADATSVVAASVDSFGCSTVSFEIEIEVAYP